MMEIIALGVSVLLTVLVSLFLSRRITRPLRHITAAATSIARGERTFSLAPGGTVPAEIQDLGASIMTMAAQLSDRADYIADFAANVSHELKSPITSIQGAAELIREEASGMPAAQRDKFLKNVQADAARMERLVVRLLELARIQSTMVLCIPSRFTAILLPPCCMMPCCTAITFCSAAAWRLRSPGDSATVILI